MAINAINFNAADYEKQTYNNVKQVLRASNALDVPALGLGRAITTLTRVIKDVVEAKYYTVPQPLTEYVKINASGEGAWSQDLFQYTEAGVSASFKECSINPFSTGIHNEIGRAHV